MTGGTRWRPSAGDRPGPHATPEAFTTLMALGEADSTTRQRRQLGEQAIAHATRGEWEEAVDTNRQLLELGPDIDAYNRLGKALAELNRTTRGPRGLRAGARARRHQPHRAAQRRAAAHADGRRQAEHEERQGPDRQGSGDPLHRGDGQDRTRPAHQPRRPSRARPAARRATRSSWSSSATSSWRASGRRRSAASSRASRPGS